MEVLDKETQIVPDKNLEINENNDALKQQVRRLFNLPFPELLYRAMSVHRANFNPQEVQASQLLSIKTGGCAENCGYCSQSAHNETGLKASKILDTDIVVAAAQKAKDNGASRFCMGAAWRELKDRDVPKLTDMVAKVKGLGLETCMTLGMLTKPQAEALKEAGLDYYNHNLDTSPEYYSKIVTTRTYDERLDTLKLVKEAGMKTCCGGILGMGESREDRISLIAQFAGMSEQPDSIPINNLVPVRGTPVGDKMCQKRGVSNLEFIRTIAVTRIMCPKSYVRLSAGRESMSDELQTLAYCAGANSIFIGTKLLTTPNKDDISDESLFEELGLKAV